VRALTPTFAPSSAALKPSKLNLAFGPWRTAAFAKPFSGHVPPVAAQAASCLLSGTSCHNAHPPEQRVSLGWSIHDRFARRPASARLSLDSGALRARVHRTATVESALAGNAEPHSPCHEVPCRQGGIGQPLLEAPCPQEATTEELARC
jgi:hypothetical protein